MSEGNWAVVCLYPSLRGLGLISPPDAQIKRTSYENWEMAPLICLWGRRGHTQVIIIRRFGCFCCCFRPVLIRILLLKLSARCVCTLTTHAWITNPVGRGGGISSSKVRRAAHTATIRGAAKIISHCSKTIWAAWAQELRRQSFPSFFLCGAHSMPPRKLVCQQFFTAKTFISLRQVLQITRVNGWRREN